MSGLDIFLICLVCIAFIYVVGLIVCIACLFAFRDRLERRIAAMSVLYSEMKELLLSWKELLEKAGCRWDEKMTNSGAQIASLRTELKSEHESLLTFELLSSYEKELKRLSRLFPSGTTPSPNPDRYYNPPFRHSLLPCAYDKPRILISVNSRKDHAVQSLLRRINLRLTAHRDAHINQPQELALEAFIGIEHHHHVVVSVHQIIEVPRRQFHLRVNPFALLTSFFRV